MCGISGIFTRGGSTPVDRAALFRMSDTLTHRGPDGEGYLIDRNLGLGHRRLKVIDLTDAGHQPMATQDSLFWIVFNGEIYNYIELREELEDAGYTFKSRSDTEVLLYAYAHYGKDCLEKLNGMFAFAVWDRKERLLFLARDRFGIKPLYYCSDETRFLFASEAKAILAGQSCHADPDPVALSDYLTFQYVLDDRTLFQNIRKLMPGHCMTIDEDGLVSLDQYWTPRFDKVGCSIAEAQQQLQELIADSVRIQLRSDVPLGTHLSGGMDTALVAALTSRQSDAPLQAFTGAFVGAGGIYDDTQRTERTADQLGAQLHVATPDPNDLMGSFDRLIWAMDEPAAAPGSFPQYFVSKLAADHVTVVLGGQGADELCGGYVRHFLLYLEAATRAGIHGESDQLGLTLSDLTPYLAQLRGYMPLMQSYLEQGWGEAWDARYFRLIARAPAPASGLDPGFVASLEGYRAADHFAALFNGLPAETELLDRVLDYETRISLPALLQVEDRTSMAWSLETRVPLLDHRIADFLFSLPAAVKFRGGRMKYILRQAAAGLVPVEILERSDKIGFPVPLNRWFDGPLADWLGDRLTGGGLTGRGIFTRDAIEAAIGSDGEFGRSRWGMLCLESWYRNFVDGEGLRGTDPEDTRPRPVIELLA